MAASSRPRPLRSATARAKSRAGDLDGDGDIDFITTNYSGNSVSVLLNNGLGAFTAAPAVAVGTVPRGVALGDLDGDGDLDFVAANYQSNTVSVMLNNGNGAFTQATGSPVAVGTRPVAVALANFDGDSDLDIAVTSNTTNTVSILLNNGAGGFTAAAPAATGAGPRGIAAGDFDGDGDVDLVVANFGANTFSILSNNGSGVFTALGAPLATANNPYAVTVGDLDGDGDLDIAATNSGSSSINVFRNDGSGAFTPASGSPFAVGVSPGGIVMGDFDEDGDLDLSTANFGSSTTSILINTAALYSVIYTLPTLEGTPPGAGGDLVFTVSRTATSEAEDVTYALGGTATAGGDYTVPSGTVSFAIGQSTVEIHIAITPDATIEPNESVSVTLTGASGDGFINPAAAVAFGMIVNDDGSTRDFNGDGKADILLQNDDGTPGVWFMDGTTVTGGAVLPNPGPTWHAAAAADFNDDGKSDILWQNDDGTPAVWFMDGTTVTGGAALPNLGPTWHAAAAADFNGDGKSDNLWQNDDRDCRGSGSWTAPRSLAAPPFPILGLRGMPLQRPISTATASPISFGRTMTEPPGVWFMDGTTVTGGAALPNPGPTWHVAAAADFSDDGKSDILWQNDDGTPGSGSWTAPRSLAPPPFPILVATGTYSSPYRFG